MQQQEEGLKREIGVGGLSANIVNIIIGAGIFALPALIAANLGNAAILAYLFCGLLVILVMLCFAEVGSIVTVSGGPYAYIEEAFGKYAGFLALFLFLISSITADGAVANALADILSAVFPVFQQPVIRIVFFVCMFGGLGYLNIRGVRQGIGLVKLTTAAKLIPLLLLIVVGATQIEADHLAWQGMPELHTLVETALLLFFAFQGAETGLLVSGEVRNPSRTVPRSILIGVAAVLVVYILIQIISQGVLGFDLPTYTEAPLSQVGRVVFGPAGFVLLTVGAAVSMFGNLSGELLNLPRMVFRAAKDNVLPVAALAKVHPAFKTPYLAIAVYAAMGCIFAIGGGFAQLAVISSAGMLLIYLGVVCSVIKFRSVAKRGDDPGAFRLPWGYAIPVLAVLIVLWMLSGLGYDELVAAAIYIGVLSVIYGIISLARKKNTAG